MQSFAPYTMLSVLQLSSPNVLSKCCRSLLLVNVTEIYVLNKKRNVAKFAWIILIVFDFDDFWRNLPESAEQQYEVLY